MSNVNIKRAVENIRANTTVYTPLIEMIVNAIQAIDEAERADGEIWIRAYRGNQLELDGSLPEIISFEIEDNGIGFTDEHRNSFDTLYTDIKIEDGGKGFGRFTCLKYFEDLHVKSVYREGDEWKVRRFSMGKDNDIVVDESVTTSEQRETATVVTLSALKRGPKGPFFEKKLSTVARILVERLLPYFITQDYVCPKIVLSEHDGSDPICLNEFVSNELSAMIREIGGRTFTLQTYGSEEEFTVRVFKLYAPRTKSRISLVAHRREVSGSVLHKYIPEFEDEFYEKDQNGEIVRDRNYIIKACVFGPYLDRNVSLERGGFEFPMERDLEHPIGQAEIEKRAALIAKEAAGTDITLRQEKKRERVHRYVESEAPWHKDILRRIDLSAMSYNATDAEIETCLQKEKFEQETEIKKGIAKLLEKDNFESEKDVLEIVGRISDTSKNDLIHYIALRRNVLDLFTKSLEMDRSGGYSPERMVHDIIFPRKGDTDTTPYQQHNLWILDERLNFTTYVASDKTLNGKNTERPDLIAYNRRVLFRGDNQPSNPITIFEFKKPGRDDFVNRSSHEDPVEQIIRYVNDIRDDKYRTPEGRPILVTRNTLFYGYVVCEFTKRVETWLDRVKCFTMMPDGLGWFHWYTNINLYVEVISWDKVLKDAKMRNQIFFHKLGI